MKEAVYKFFLHNVRGRADAIKKWLMDEFNRVSWTHSGMPNVIDVDYITHEELLYDTREDDEEYSEEGAYESEWRGSPPERFAEIIVNKFPGIRVVWYCYELMDEGQYHEED